MKLDYSGGLVIGENVVISESSTIYTHDHGADPKSVPVKTPLTIEDNVWIGGHAIIIEGVGRIGHGAWLLLFGGNKRSTSRGCCWWNFSKAYRQKEYLGFIK